MGVVELDRTTRVRRTTSMDFSIGYISVLGYVCSNHDQLTKIDTQRYLVRSKHRGLWAMWKLGSKEG